LQAKSKGTATNPSTTNGQRPFFGWRIRKSATTFLPRNGNVSEFVQDHESTHPIEGILALILAFQEQMGCPKSQYSYLCAKLCALCRKQPSKDVS
jgi:hypothetical protein